MRNRSFGVKYQGNKNTSTIFIEVYFISESVFKLQIYKLIFSSVLLPRSSPYFLSVHRKKKLQWVRATTTKNTTFWVSRELKMFFTSTVKSLGEMVPQLLLSLYECSTGGCKESVFTYHPLLSSTVSLQCFHHHLHHPFLCWMMWRMNLTFPVGTIWCTSSSVSFSYRSPKSENIWKVWTLKYGPDL